MRTLDGIMLARGAHKSPEAGMCAMEAAAYIAGEPHTDHPECVSPVVAAFMRIWNDDLPDGATRTRLLAPLVPLTVGTRTSPEDDEARAWLATDWLVRECAPPWLRLAGLVEHADALSSLPQIAGADDALAAQPMIAAARDALALTVTTLQSSAQDLVRRMCAVGREGAA